MKTISLRVPDSATFVVVKLDYDDGSSDAAKAAIKIPKDVIAEGAVFVVGSDEKRTITKCEECKYYRNTHRTLWGDEGVCERYRCKTYANREKCVGKEIEVNE